MAGTVPTPEGNATERSRSLLLSSGLWRVLGILALVIVLLGGGVRALLVQRFTIPSSSMEPTLMVGETITVWRPDALRERIDRGDIVVFDGRGSFVAGAPPTRLQSAASWVGLGDRDVYYVKRVIGLGGDTIECCDADGRLVRNGTAVDEDYAPLPASAEEFTVEVPPDTMWVMGDNRDASGDSRSLLGRPGGGFIPLSQVIGTVIGFGSAID